MFLSSNDKNGLCIVSAFQPSESSASYLGRIFGSGEILYFLCFNLNGVLVRRNNNSSIPIYNPDSEALLHESEACCPGNNYVHS